MRINRKNCPLKSTPIRMCGQPISFRASAFPAKAIQPTDFKCEQIRAFWRILFSKKILFFYHKQFQTVSKYDKICIIHMRFFFLFLHKFLYFILAFHPVFYKTIVWKSLLSDVAAALWRSLLLIRRIPCITSYGKFKKTTFV